MATISEMLREMERRARAEAALRAAQKNLSRVLSGEAKAADMRAREETKARLAARAEARRAEREYRKEERLWREGLTREYRVLRRECDGYAKRDDPAERGAWEEADARCDEIAEILGWYTH